MLACDMRRSENKKWGCGILLFHPNKSGYVLLCKRATSEDQEPFSWGFPGGKVDTGETALEAVIREVKEETGLTVYDCKYIGSYIEGGYRDFVFLSNKWSGDIVLDPNECSEYKWVTLSEIKEQCIVAPIFSYTLATVEFCENWVNFS